MKPVLLAAALLSAIIGTAQAQTDPVPQDKIYVSDKSACSLLQSKGAAAYEDKDFLSLSFKDGIQGMEFHCSFFDVKTKPGNAFTVVTAMCEVPGDSYADLLAISPYTDDTVRVSSMNDTLFATVTGSGSDGEAPPDATGQADPNAAGIPPGSTLYYRCDNLSELPH